MNCEKKKEKKKKWENSSAHTNTVISYENAISFISQDIHKHAHARTTYYYIFTLMINNMVYFDVSLSQFTSNNVYTLALY